MKKDDEWQAKYFYTSTELNNFIEPLKSKLLGKSIDKIMITGHIYTSCGYDDKENYCVKYSCDEKWVIEDNNVEKQIQSLPTHKVSLSLDDPLILCFGNIHFEINYCEFSNAQIGINTLNSMSNADWQDVSDYFVKNIIGKKLLDIKINQTCIPNKYTSHYRKNGEKMYDEIVFVFENGYQLEISSDIDYMSLAERIIWQEQQDLAQRDWDCYYDSKQYLDDNEKTFKELIAESIPINGNNMRITANDEYSTGFLDYYFEINNNGIISKCYYGFAINNMNFLWNFVEAMVMSKNDCYLCCEEEGPETYFYIQNLDDDKIRFIHISNRIQDEGLVTEDYKVRQDFITSKYNFIKQFYTCLIQPIRHFNKTNMSKVCLDEYNEFYKNSIIVKKYLELYNC